MPGRWAAQRHHRKRWPGAKQPGRLPVGLAESGPGGALTLSISQVCENPSSARRSGSISAVLGTVEQSARRHSSARLSHSDTRGRVRRCPLLDGSALAGLEAIAEAGLTTLGERAPLQELLSPDHLQQGPEGFATALPAPALDGAGVQLSQPAIGRQALFLEITPRSFCERRSHRPAPSASASTVEQLQKAG